jgi:hypothetical protein
MHILNCNKQLQSSADLVERKYQATLSHEIVYEIVT